VLQNVVYSADTKSVEFVAKAFFNQQTQEWDLVEGAGGVTYNGGTTVAPVDADRPAHDKSFYDDATVAVSYLFCACNICLALFCGIWTIAFRARKIVKHSQPEFLVMICAGCMLSSATILGLAQSNDKGAAEDVGIVSNTATATTYTIRNFAAITWPPTIDPQAADYFKPYVNYTEGGTAGADMACMATVWCFSLGFILTFGALFAKIWVR
jgi:hypothetical protein